MQLYFRLSIVIFLITVVTLLTFLSPEKTEPVAPIVQKQMAQEYVMVLEWMRDEIQYCADSINEDQEQIKGATICHAKRTDKGIVVILDVSTEQDIAKVHEKLVNFLDKKKFTISPPNNQEYTIEILILTKS